MLKDPLKPLVVYGLAAACALADQASKAAVRGALELGQSWPVTGFFSLHHVRNQGAAWSLLHGQVSLLAAVAIAVVIGMIALERSRRALPALGAAALGILLGGTLGNLTDRLLRGAVTDFLDVFVGRWHWPTFNVADVCVNVGVFGLLLVTLSTPVPPASEEPRR